MRNMFLVGASLLALTPSAVEAQDVLVMRRAVAPKKVANPANEVLPIGSPADGYEPAQGQSTTSAYWAATPWTMGPPACRLDSKATRNVACVYNGVTVEESRCTGSKPEAEQTTPDYRDCSYVWTIVSKGPWQGEQCSDSTRSVTAECQSPATGETVDPSLCPGEAPTAESGFNDEGCSYSWSIGAWGNYDSTCSSSAKRIRNVACARSDGTTVADSKCSDEGPKPDIEEVTEVLTNCDYRYVATAWTLDGPAATTCGGEANYKRTVSCQGPDGSPTDMAECQSLPMPALAKTDASYDACSTEWQAGEWTGWSSQCSAISSRTRSITCVREDGKVVDGGNCTETKPTSTETAPNYENCSYDWQVGSWNTVKATTCMGTTVKTRTVTCRRTDGTEAPDSSCSQPKPSAEESFSDASSCQTNWQVGTTSWNSLCSDAAMGTRPVICVREDGATLGDESCDPTNKPTATVVEAKYDSCPLQWDYTAWSDYSSTCSSSSTRTRSKSCLSVRPTVAVVVESGKCTGLPEGPISETIANYSNCSAEWTYGAWGWNGVANAASSTCSATPQQTRTATCQKRDSSGTYQTVDQSLCDGIQKSATTQTLNANFAGCSYDWSPNDTTSGWSAWSSTCSANATRTRSVQCLRSDGTPAGSDNLCTGTKPATSQTTAVYDGCQSITGDGTFETAIPKYGTGSKDAWFGQYNAIALSTDAHSGAYSAQLPGGSNSLYFPNAVISSTKYQISFWCKGPGSVSVRVQDFTGGGYTSSSFPCSSTAWTLITTTRTYASTGTTNVSVNAASAMKIDDFQMIPM